MSPVNYFEILRCYQEFKIPKSVGAKANSLFLAILFKANVLRFPRTLTIYNSEALDLSGLTKDELYPARNKLAQTKINGQFIMKYSGNGTKSAGSYVLNYEGLSNYFQHYTENPTNSKDEKDYSDNPTKPTTNGHTNPHTNDEVKPETLVGFSDSLLTKQTEQTDQTKHVLPPNAFSVFESEGFGQITSTIRDSLGDLIDTYTEPWVIEAMKESVVQGIRSLSYVHGILKRWKAKGIDSPWKNDKPKNRSSSGKPHIPIISKPESEELSDEEFEAMVDKAGRLDAKWNTSGLTQDLT